jgi:membrane glycosyltransferase
VAWRDAARRFGMPGAVAAAALLAMAQVDGLAAAWLAPIALPLLLAVPLSVATSLPALGLWLRRRQLLLTPEEAWTPTVLRRATAYAGAHAAAAARTVSTRELDALGRVARSA